MSLFSHSDSSITWSVNPSLKLCAKCVDRNRLAQHLQKFSYLKATDWDALYSPGPRFPQIALLFPSI